jgi:hypothetical protein
MIIKSEFNTPQQNGKVERAYATLYGKTRSILNAARITIPLRHGLWANCANLSVQLENSIVKDKDQQSAPEMITYSDRQQNGIIESLYGDARR